MPPTVTAPWPVSKRTAQCLARVSVVMMARAASTPPAGDSWAAAARRPATTGSTGSGTPMTPVERTRAVLGGRPAACSAAWAIARAASRPAVPVQAFATRAFIATARTRPGRSLSRSASYNTGAARTALRVNTPAVAQLVALTSSATSGAPSALSPACTAAAEKPRGEVTDPSGSESSVAVIGGQDSGRHSLVKPPGVSYHSTTFPGGPFDVGPVLELRRLRRTCASALQRRTLRRSPRDAARGTHHLPPCRGAPRGDGVCTSRTGGVSLDATRVRGGAGARPRSRGRTRGIGRGAAQVRGPHGRSRVLRSHPGAGLSRRSRPHAANRPRAVSGRGARPCTPLLRDRGRGPSRLGRSGRVRGVRDASAHRRRRGTILAATRPRARPRARGSPRLPGEPAVRSGRVRGGAVPPRAHRAGGALRRARYLAAHGAEEGGLPARRRRPRAPAVESAPRGAGGRRRT